MKIKQWDKDTGGMMVLVTQQEAISIIKSLAHQIKVKDCNNGREEFFDDDGREFSIGVVEGDVLFRGEKISEPKDEEKINLSGCYHTSLAYSLGYYANGEIELVGETFTNLDTGIDGGVMAALKEYRKNFRPLGDIPYFIVALKPVKVILGKEEDEKYGLETCPYCDEIYDDCGCECEVCNECNSLIDECICPFCEICEDLLKDCRCNGYGCFCDIDDDGNFCDMCSKRFDEDMCYECCGPIDECICQYDDDGYCNDCQEICTDCDCDGCNEPEEGYSPLMNAFARARFLKTQGE